MSEISHHNSGCIAVCVCVNILFILLVAKYLYFFLSTQYGVDCC